PAVGPGPWQAGGPAHGPRGNGHGWGVQPRRPNRRDRGKDNKVRFWDARTGKPSGEPMVLAGPISALGFTRDGHTLLVANEVGPYPQRGELHFRNPVLRGHDPQGKTEYLPYRVSEIRFSPDGKTFLLAGGGVQLWDTVARRPLTPRLSDLSHWTPFG